MATITLYDPEDLDYELPRVCMVCARRARTYKRKGFSWNPGWVYILLLAGLLPFVIVALILTKRRTVEVPLCGRHRHHWLARQGLMLGSLVGLLGAIFGTLALTPRNVPDLFFLGVLGGLIGWIVLVVIVNMGMIRPTSITEDSISLQGVSAGFKDALKEWRRNLDEQLDEERAYWRGPRRRRDEDGRHEEENRDRHRGAIEQQRPRRPRDEYRAEEE
jgi:hypothetical protein